MSSSSTITPTREHRAGEHPPSPATQPSGRVGALDRIALRLGLALITWSRRSRSPESWERRATRVEAALAHDARAAAALRLALRTAPPR